MCTPRYFAAMQLAKKLEMQNQWEQTRFVAYVVAKTVDSKNKIRKPHDLLPFSWDAPVRAFKPLTDEDKEELMKFDAEADEVLRITNPEAYAAYMAGKTAKNGN